MLLVERSFTHYYVKDDELEGEFKFGPSSFFIKTLLNVVDAFVPLCSKGEN